MKSFTTATNTRIIARRAGSVNERETSTGALFRRYLAGYFHNICLCYTKVLYCAHKPFILVIIKRNHPVNPIFKDILDAHTKPVRNSPVCFFCDHVVDLQADQYVRIPTLESITNGKPEAFAHELCAAEAEAEHLQDKAHEDYMDWVAELEDEDA